jgi:hypothetical protein
LNGPSETVIDLLKTYGDNEEAVSAIRKGAEKDCRRRIFHKDKDRQRCKRSALDNFVARTGPFAPDGEMSDDFNLRAALMRIGQLEQALKSQGIETTAAAPNALQA